VPPVADPIEPGHSVVVAGDGNDASHGSKYTVIDQNQRWSFGVPACGSS